MPTALVLSGGGPLAVAWECGLVAGLARAGPALNSMDFILGTSAGAIVGAQLAAGRNPEAMANAIIAEIDGVPPPGAMPHYPIPAVMKLPDLFALSQAGEAGRVEVGSYALSASTTETETAYVERMKLAIGIDDWPNQDIGLVAVDIADGKPRMLRRDCGATFATAIAASCCLPGLSPPVTISGRRYMDGGMRSTANADLVSGFDSILVLCFHPPGQPGERMLIRVATQTEPLVKGGARVCVISPDEASLAAIGPRTMDVVRRPEVARAALAQGAAAADTVASFWGETRQQAR
jgi:NTE family protein